MLLLIYHWEHVFPFTSTIVINSIVSDSLKNINETEMRFSNQMCPCHYICDSWHQYRYVITTIKNM